MAPPRRAGLSAAQGGGWPHRCAVLSCVCTVALILAGGVVTSTGSGLAVPDWPTTFGYNMFLFPWSKMVGGIFIEHAHRLLGSLVGILTILTAAALLWKDERRWLRLLGLAAVALVIVQGVLGGMRVGARQSRPGHRPRLRRPDFLRSDGEHRASDLAELA